MIVFFIYQGNELPEYKDVFEKMKKVLQKLEKIIDENMLQILSLPFILIDKIISMDHFSMARAFMQVYTNLFPIWN